MIIDFNNYIDYWYSEKIIHEILGKTKIPHGRFVGDLILEVPPECMIIDPSQCWIYTGGSKNSIYKTKSCYGVNYPVHRLMYDLKHKDLSAHNHVHHICGIPNCINFWHIEQISVEDHLSGEANGGAKLTYEQVNQMREEFSNGKYSYRQLSEKYDVCERHVRKIIAFEKWKKGSKNHPKK